MSVLVETTHGNFTIDLLVDECPSASRNFLKLCKIKYFNGVLFYNVQADYVAQTGDPTGTGEGGSSIYGLLQRVRDGGASSAGRYFEPENRPHLKHSEAGTVSMPFPCGSQWLVTTRADCASLDGHAAVFGHVVEGLDSTLLDINGAFCDGAGRPYADIRIRHTYVLVDPFPDPAGLEGLLPPLPIEGEDGDAGSRSPRIARPAGETVPERLSTEEAVTALDTAGEAALAASHAEREARSRAVILEMVGDLPSADAAPPEQVLFVCKLNPVTSEEDLGLIFGRFGEVRGAHVIRDARSGDSLCYGFIEFGDVRSAEAAYAKMDNVLIDDRRIRVDFSQSVSHLWERYRKGGKRQARDAVSLAAGQGRTSGAERPGGARGGPRPPFRPPAPPLHAGTGGVGALGNGGGGLPRQPPPSASSGALAPAGGPKRSRWGPDAGPGQLPIVAGPAALPPQSAAAAVAPPAPSGGASDSDVGSHRRGDERGDRVGSGERGEPHRDRRDDGRDRRRRDRQRNDDRERGDERSDGDDGGGRGDGEMEREHPPHHRRRHHRSHRSHRHRDEDDESDRGDDRRKDAGRSASGDGDRRAQASGRRHGQQADSGASRHGSRHRSRSRSRSRDRDRRRDGGDSASDRRGSRRDRSPSRDPREEGETASSGPRGAKHDRRGRDRDREHRSGRDDRSSH